MAISTLAEVAKERGSITIAVSLLDESGDAFVPLTFKWTLTDKRGTVINSRQGVVVPGEDLGETITIKLDGADLPVTEVGRAQGTLLLTVQGTYVDQDLETRNFSEGVYILVDNLAGIQTA